MSKHVQLDHDVNTAVGFNANFTFKYISLVVIYVCLTFKNQWPVNICIFVHTEKLFSVCLINVTVLKCLLLPYRKVTGQVLRRICGSCFISLPPWCQQTGMNLDSLNMVEEQEGKKKYIPARLTQVCLYWVTDRLTVLDMFHQQIKVTLWSGADSLAMSGAGFVLMCRGGGEMNF